jgi:hypothetical protein
MYSQIGRRPRRRAICKSKERTIQQRSRGRHGRSTRHLIRFLLHSTSYAYSTFVAEHLTRELYISDDNRPDSLQTCPIYILFLKQIPLWVGYLSNRASDMYEFSWFGQVLYDSIMIEEFRGAIGIYFVGMAMVL